MSGTPNVNTIHLPPPELRDVAKLHLDPKNPRIVEMLEGEPSERDLIKFMWDENSVKELALSIAHNGFFEHEPLFAEQDGTSFVVLEGNRRLAAVKILLDDSLRKYCRATDLPALSLPQKEALQTIPVILASRQDSWRFVGFKHVNGPKQWGSYAKAQYITQVHRDFGIPLEEIAETIGDTNTTVERLYRANRLLEQAEDKGLFNLTDTYKGRLAFSHFYTGIGYANVQSFLGISSSTRAEDIIVDEAHEPQLKDYLLWLYGSRELNIEPVVSKQNPDLRRLDAILDKSEGIETLKVTNSLDKAERVAKGEKGFFRDKIIRARLELQDAVGSLSTGVELDDVLRRYIEKDHNLSEQLRELTSKRIKVRRSSR